MTRISFGEMDMRRMSMGWRWAREMEDERGKLDRGQVSMLKYRRRKEEGKRKEGGLDYRGCRLVGWSSGWLGELGML